jgi:N6-L-threonylcarbamoyladenine synthase
VATAKGLAAARRLPLAPVDHLQGHVAATSSPRMRSSRPFLCLIASGGHTLLARVTAKHGYGNLGHTLDDAAGEAFDKGARLLGLGYPGGPALSRLAAEGDPAAFAFPTAARVSGLDFSFAGLKTALLYAVRDLGEEETERRAADLAASYEHAIVEALVLRIERALRAEPQAKLAIGGGVAANRVLRRAARRSASTSRCRRRALHGQRGDDRLGGALGRAAALSGLPRPGRLRHRQAARGLRCRRG